MDKAKQNKFVHSVCIGFGLALLARSAYFALLCPNGQSIKSSICGCSEAAKQSSPGFVKNGTLKVHQDLDLY